MYRTGEFSFFEEHRLVRRILLTHCHACFTKAKDECSQVENFIVRPPTASIPQQIFNRTDTSVYYITCQQHVLTRILIRRIFQANFLTYQVIKAKPASSTILVKFPNPNSITNFVIRVQLNFSLGFVFTTRVRLSKLAAIIALINSGLLSTYY